MIATETHEFRITHEENVELLKRTATKGIVLDMVFGPGWSALVWNKGDPIPDSVRELASIRGVYVENLNGAGI